MMNRKPKRGFTLVELVVTLAITGIIAVVLAGILRRAADAHNKTGTRGAIYQEAGAALDVIIRKLQTTPVRTLTNPGVPAITSFAAGTIVWDDSSQLDLTGTAIRLRDVQNGDAAGMTPVSILDDVTVCTFTPYDESNTNLYTSLGVSTLNSAQSATIRRVLVTITVVREGQTVTLRSRAFLRAGMSGTSG